MKHAYSNAMPGSGASSAAHDTHIPAARPANRSWSILSTLLTWQSRSEGRRHLRELDDRLLKDVGLTRADAQYESSKPFWKA